MLKQIVTSAIAPTIKQKHYRRHRNDDDYSPDTVSDGCAKAFVVIAFAYFAARALWKFMI